jgi:DNA-binding response OmpR family regulator
MVHKVLVIDDEAVLVETIAYNLEHAGYQVVTAVDGVSGLTALSREMPDLIILDLMLPEMDGLDFCRQVRRGKNTATIPIMMLTTRDLGCFLLPDLRQPEQWRNVWPVYVNRSL